MNLFLILMFKKPGFFSKTFLWINLNISQFHEHIFRSSRSQMFIKIGILKSFPNFREKHLCWSLRLKACKFILKVFSWKRVLSCEVCEIFKNTFFTEHLRWLLLHFRRVLLYFFFKNVIKQLLLFRNLVMTY